jgi:hypothetical protein
VHNGNGPSNGKRWLLVGLLILFGIWFVNNSYDDGYRDALIQTGQVANARGYGYHGGPHFPWGLLILGGIGYIAWRKGAFDRFGGPGGPFGGGGRYVRSYGPGPEGGFTPPQGPGDAGSGQGFGTAFRGPRGFFDEWHRQAHEAEQGRQPSPPTQSAPPAPPAGPSYAQAGNGVPPAEGFAAPPPPPPAPDYWAAMAREAGAGGQVTAPAPGTHPEARADGNAGTQQGGTGPALERW